MLSKLVVLHAPLIYSLYVVRWIFRTVNVIKYQSCIVKSEGKIVVNKAYIQVNIKTRILFDINTIV